MTPARKFLLVGLTGGIATGKSTVSDILRRLGVRSVDLVTNNPRKIAGLAEAGMPVRRRIALPSPANPHNLGYLTTKRERTGHLIELATGTLKRTG
jgi:hypothetical protein